MSGPHDWCMIERLRNRFQSDHTHIHSLQQMFMFQFLHILADTQGSRLVNLRCPNGCVVVFMVSFEE